MDLRFGEFMKDLRKENGQRVDNRRGSRMTYLLQNKENLFSFLKIEPVNSLNCGLN